MHMETLFALLTNVNLDLSRGTYLFQYVKLSSYVLRSNQCSTTSVKAVVCAIMSVVHIKEP